MAKNKITTTDIKVRKSHFDFYKFVYKPKYAFICGTVLLFVQLFFANYVINVILNTNETISKLTQSNIFNYIDELYYQFKTLANFFIFKYSNFKFFLIITPLITLLTFYNIYKYYRKYRHVDYGQEGDSRFATLEEVQQQYKEIPHTDVEYDGTAGFPISHFEDKYYIDTETHNTCIIGTSRSGKGESAVTVAIDIDSRAKEKASLIIGDPKQELEHGSTQILIEGGYRTLSLNLMNPDDSIGYNPLELIKRQYLLGNYSKAEKYVSTLTNQIYFDPNAKDPFWNDSASNLIKAITLALLVQTHKNGELEKFTMYNVAKMLTNLGGNTDEDENNLLDLYFKKLEPSHIAKDAYAQSNFSTGNTRGSIFTVAMGKLQIFLEQDIAKMTSNNTVDLRRFGFKKLIDVQFDDLFKFRKGHYFFTRKKENIVEKISEKRRIRLNGYSSTEIVFKDNLENDDRINFEFEVEDKTYKMSYSLKFFKESSKVNTQEETIKFNYLENVSTEGFEPKYINGIYSNKPIGLYLVVPDYDSSRNVIATLFISQMYTLLAEMTSNRDIVENGKCHNFVKFRLDEFGNLPAIKDFEQILTVCCGRLIIFEAYVQSYSQIFAKYGNVNGKTIKENFQNHVYILTTDESTAEEISKKCGYKTVTKKQKSINDDSKKVSYTYIPEKREIILPQDLLQIHETHTVVL